MVMRNLCVNESRIELPYSQNRALSAAEFVRVAPARAQHGPCDASPAALRLAIPMSLAPPLPSSCRVCQAEVLATDLTCPHCGAPRPARAEFSGEGYEWCTAATWLGS